ncbi:MAG: DUF5642 family protein [Mycobacterium sp.]
MVSTGVRLHPFIVLVMVAATGCSAPAHEPRPGPSSPAAEAGKIDPANLRRLRGSFPTGYEIAEFDGVASPAKYWGLTPGWVAQPARCGALADPAADGSSTQVLSGSGSGGIIYVALADASSTGPDTDVVAGCSHWTMKSGRTTATVDLTAAPAIENAATVAMVADSRTVVEGGTETGSHATTATAYLGDYVAFVTVVTDPGSGPSELPPDFAPRFLAQAVATLRG